MSCGWYFGLLGLYDSISLSFVFTEFCYLLGFVFQLAACPVREVVECQVSGHRIPRLPVLAGRLFHSAISLWYGTLELVPVAAGYDDVAQVIGVVVGQVGRTVAPVGHNVGFELVPFCAA